MPKYRKRPVVVEAEQWFPGKDVPGVFMHQPPDAIIGGRGHGEQRFPQDPYPAVRTKQGEVVRIAPGEWVIVEADDSGHYPCHPDTFAATYDLEPETVAEPPGVDYGWTKNHAKVREAVRQFNESLTSDD